MKLLFPRKPILGHKNGHFLTRGVTAFEHEVFGSSQWVQERYQPCGGYLKEKGKPLAFGL